MNRSNIHLLDLPDEILLIIFKKLNNIDVLYSLLNINNQRLNRLTQEKAFRDILDFVSVDDISSTNRLKLDQFLADILPQIHHHVKHLIIKPVFMERTLLAGDYPNLTKLELIDFTEETISSYFIDQSIFRYIFQEQITDLVLINRDKSVEISSRKAFTKSISEHIFNFFNHLKHLTIIQVSCQGVTFYNLPSTTFSSSILTHLNVNVVTFKDCLYLLDGRLKQLRTLIITIYCMGYSTITLNTENLPRLKCFSLQMRTRIKSYDERLLPLLRHLTYLEKLTLYLCVRYHNRLIDGIDLQDDILLHMPRLQSFLFHICNYIDVTHLTNDLSSDDIQQTFTYTTLGHVASATNYLTDEDVACCIFSLPFAFDRLETIGNQFPDVIFSHVLYLSIEDILPFNHQFFLRISRAFPQLKNLRISNYELRSTWNENTSSCDNSECNAIAQYPHLTTLDVLCAISNYLDQFLNETKSYAPSLSKVKVMYDGLTFVTNNFTREETRRNCANIQRVEIFQPLVFPKEFYLYFPSL